MTRPPRVIVLGAGGQLGRQIVSRFHQSGVWDARGFRRVDLDVTDTTSIQRVVDSTKPRWIVNTAAITDVDGCENQTDRANEVNGYAVERLASVCDAAGATLVQLSTDYVFGGNASSPYLEDTPTDPLSAYAKSKLRGETAARQTTNHLIVRMAWLYGTGGRNFIDAIVGRAEAGEALRVVDDQFGCPSYAVDMAECLERLMQIEAEGVFHAANGESASRHETAIAAIEFAGLSAEIEPIPTSAYPLPAKRPRYAVLDCTKYTKATGHVPRPWRKALADYIKSSRDI